MTAAAAYGVRIVGVGSAVPRGTLTNADLEKLMNTSDQWIIQRTGIRQRHAVDPETEGEFDLALAAMQRALDDAGISGGELDLIIHASTTSEMVCPPNACRIAAEVGADGAGGFDLVAACSGFVYALNVAETLVRSGRYQTVGVVGGDALTTISDYSERTMSILSGDGAGAMVLKCTDDAEQGCLYQTMGGDGARWDALYMPLRDREVPDWDKDSTVRYGTLRMAGREVFKFAVTKFREVIKDALDQTGLSADQISQFVCHQSNARIIQAARDKLGLPPEKVLVNIDEYGNTSAGSVGIVFDELWKAGKIHPGDYIIFVAFGGGLTWASSVWKI